MFITDNATRQDAIARAAMAGYLRQLRKEETYRDMVRRGLIEPTREVRWNVSDRD